MTESDRLLRYERVVSWQARELYVPGLDSADVLQEAWSAALVGIRTYRADMGMSERSFVVMCVRRHLFTLIKKALQQKRTAFRERLSLSGMVADGLEIGDTIASSEPGPEQIVIGRDELARLSRMAMSPRERDVLVHLVADSPIQVGATELGVSYKSFDNTVQRLRKKARRCLEAA